MWLPIKHYLVSFESPETETASGLVLPTPDYWRPCQGTVIGLPLAPAVRLQAGRGDGVVCPPAHVAWCDYPREGFVRDEDLLAVQREVTGDMGFDWETFPARGWVALRQDQDFDRVVEGRQVRETASGVLVARGDRVPGADLQLRRRGEELYRELTALGYHPRLLHEPSAYYRHRMVWDFLDGLTTDERSALGEAIQRGGDLESSERIGAYWRGSGCKSGVVQSAGEGVRLQPGTHVVLDRLFRGHRFGGHLFVQADQVAAEVRSADNEEYELVSIS